MKMIYLKGDNMKNKLKLLTALSLATLLTACGGAKDKPADNKDAASTDAKVTLSVQLEED